jgi:segregation and condensation protein B
MTSEDLRALVEAILLTNRGPVAVETISDTIGDEANDEAIESVIVGLQREWDDGQRGIRIERVAGGWRCFTPPQLDPYLRSFHGVAARHRLSQAALEVLAIVAHRQPVTLPEINFIRGANSTGVARTLLDRSLIRVAGRKKVVGKPFLYRTTREFLVHFGLDSPEDLPDPEQLVADESSLAE